MDLEMKRRNPLKTGLVPASSLLQEEAHVRAEIWSQSPENGSRPCKVEDYGMNGDWVLEVAIP